MATESTVQQFILLPARGLRATGPTSSPAHASFFRATADALSSDVPYTFDTPERGKVQMRVIDKIYEDGAKLVELSPDDAFALRAHQPGLRLVPIVYYRTAVAPRFTIATEAVAERVVVAQQIKLKIVSKKDNTPIAEANVSAFTDFANGDEKRWKGDGGTTDDSGEVSLSLETAKVERLYVYPKQGFWSALRKNFTITSGMKIALTPLDLQYNDVLRYFYGSSSDKDGEGVKVGICDTGVGPHSDLKVEGGENEVVGENKDDYWDGSQHGSHVAGIIAANGKIHGLAPAAILRSYRVFARYADETSNYHISKGIASAVRDECDLINVSISGPRPIDEAVKAAIEDARSQGSLVIVASGNNNRSPVGSPAYDSLCIAISAMGRKGTFPEGSVEEEDVAAPYGKDKKNFVAAFSNIGLEIDLIAPGVGIISTVPQDGYAPMSGTSMACPAVVGFAAKLLSKHPDILSMNRDQARSDAMAKVLLQSAKSLGFGPKYEGHGLPK